MLLPSCRLARVFLLAVVACSFVVCSVVPRAAAQVPVASPSPARRHSLGLEAQSVANGGATQVSSNAAGVPFSDAVAVVSVGDRRVASNRTNVKISVRNFSTAPDTVRVEWFFVALPVNISPGASHEIIFDHDAQTLAIPGGKTATQVVSSPEVQAVYERGTTITTAPAGATYSGGYTSTISSSNTQRGLSIRGWMVRLVAEDGSVLDAKGSSQAYEEIAANPAKLAGMLARPGSSGSNPRTVRPGEER